MRDVMSFRDVAEEAKAPALGQSLKPSGAWRVVVELISARDLPPSSRLAQGPGMVASEGKSAGVNCCLVLLCPVSCPVIANCGECSARGCGWTRLLRRGLHRPSRHRQGW